MAFIYLFYLFYVICLNYFYITTGLEIYFSNRQEVSLFPIIIKIIIIRITENKEQFKKYINKVKNRNLLANSFPKRLLFYSIVLQYSIVSLFC